MPNVISSQEFRRIGVALFVSCGATDETAGVTVDTLLEASLSGYDSHGIMRIPRYVDECRKGIIDPKAQPEIISSDGAVVCVDGRFGFGPATVDFALRITSDRAQEFGIASFVAKNTNDVARLGSYLERVSERGLLGFLMANDAGSGPAVAPTGSTIPFLSTNPIAAVFPSKEGAPVLIDISTAATSVGKLRMAANADRHVAEGILVNSSGLSETDPKTFFQNPRASAILPLGGQLMGHKGFALSLIVEALAGALSGSGCSAGRNDSFARNGVFGLVIEPTFFGGSEAFSQSVTNLIQQLKTLTPLSGLDEGVMIPGERSQRERSIRNRDGIPVDALTWDRLRDVCQELGVGFSR